MNLPPLSSLVVGERVVSRCEDGLLDAEYALFDRGEVVVATDGVGVCEQGYLTAAGFARTRLVAAGITSELARQAFTALRPGHLRALAKSPSVLHVIDRLGPYEAFQGGTYRAAAGTYDGVWLDLEALAHACPVRGAALLFQALHLVLVLEEVPDDVPVRMLTARLTEGRRSNERTWHEVSLEPARRLPAVLYAMRVPERSTTTQDDATVSEELMRDLRARSVAAAVPLPRLNSLAALLATSNAPPRASEEPGAPPRAQPISSVPPYAPLPEQLATKDSLLDGAEPPPPFDDLRQHTELLRGEDRLRAVAHSLTMMANRSSALPEVTVLAARAWLAAGEHGYGRHLARQVVEEASVPDSVRLMALEILESTPQTNESMLPPPAIPSMPAAPLDRTPSASPTRSPSPMPEIVPARIMILAPRPLEGVDAGWPEIRTPPPALRSLASESAPAPTTVYVEAAPPIELQGQRVIELPAESEPERPAEAVVAVPVHALAVNAPIPPPPESAHAVWAEMVEGMRLPEGATEDMLPPGQTPRDPLLVRVAMTRLSRELGRDYRLWYGTALKVDSSSIDIMQRHLRRRFTEVQRDTRSASRLDAELTRHGALFSEILARRLGAAWAEITGDRPSDWVMSVPPGTRVWPVWRLYNFFRQRLEHDDLTSFYADLQRRKPPAK